MIAGNIEIQLMANIARLQQDMAEARRTVAGTMSQISASVSSAMNVLGGLAAGLSIGAFAGWIKGAIDAIDSLTDLSTRTKITVEDLAGLSYGAKLSGTELEAAAGAITKLATNMGNDPEKFRKLGIAAKEPMEAFKQLADVFKGIKDPQQRAAFGAEVLGKSWQQAAVLLDEGSEGISALMKKGQELAGVTTQMSADAALFNDRLDEIGAMATGVKIRIAADLLPMLSLLQTDLMTASKGADQVGGSFGVIGETFRALVILGGNVAFVFKTVGTEIGGIVAQVAAYYRAVFKFFTLDFKGAASEIRGAFGKDGIGEMMTRDAEKSRAAFDEWEQKWVDVGKVAAQVQAAPVPDTSEADKATAARVAAFLKEQELKAAAKKAEADAAAVAQKKVAAYEAATKSAGDFVAALQLEQVQLGLTSDQVKMMAAARAAAKAPTAELRAQIMEEALALDIASKAWAAKAAAEKAAAEMQLNFDDAASGVWEQVRAIEAEIAGYGKTAAALTNLAIVRAQAKLQSAELSEQETAALESELAGLKRLEELQSKKGLLDTGSSVAQAKELLDILTAVDAATKSAADGMAASFGKVGSAIGGLTTALSGYAVQQQAIAAQLATVKADPKSSADKISKAEIAASHASAQAKIKSYGDMAGAAKGFFKESTAGYKIMEGTEKAFRAAEMAMAVKNMLEKSGLLAAFTGLFVTSKVTESAAVVAQVPVVVAAEGVKQGAFSLSALAASLTLPPPASFVAFAATAALLAAIGLSVAGGSGGGGPSGKMAAETGTVFGDPAAKSDSIARSLELVADNSGIELDYTRGMLLSLRNIESALSGLGNLLIRNSGLTGEGMPDIKGTAQNVGDFFGQFSFADKLLGGVVGKVLGGIFGGKVSVQGTGLVVGSGSLGSIIDDGATANQYTDTKKSGGLFHSDKYRTNLTALGPEANDQITKVITNLSLGITEAGKLLGLGGTAFAEHLNQFVIDIGKIQLKGLTGEEIQKKLEAVFSTLGDNMAQFAVGGLNDFQKVGEGYMETLTRLAVNYANLDSILASTGTTFGATGMSSIAARERLIELAGGIDELASKSSSFADNFLTEAERLAPVQKYVTEQLAAMGLAGIDTRDKFKATVLGLANSGALATEAGAAQYAGLLDLADAFAKTHAATEDLTKSEQAIADESKDLQQQLNELTMTSVQLLALQRAGIADSNKALFDQIQAAKAVASAKDVLASAYDKESAALKTVAERMRAFQTSTLAFADSLKLGALSTLSPVEKAAEAQRQYEATLAKAMKGDSAAQSAINAAATAYLTADQVIKASTDAYAADAARVQADLAALAAIAGGQATDAEKQLAALDAQVGALIDINTSIKDGALTVAQAIANLAGLGYTGLAGVDGSHAGGLARVPFDGYRAELHRDEVVVDAPAAAAMRRYFGGAPSQGGGNTDALVSEIKALREEVKGLRADQAQHAGATISSIEGSADRNAAQINDGSKKAAMVPVYAKRMEGTLV